MEIAEAQTESRTAETHTNRKDAGERQKQGNRILDHGLHGLTRIKGLSHPRPSVACVVKCWGIRKPERGSGQPKRINSERGWEPRMADWAVLGSDSGVPAGRMT